MRGAFTGMLHATFGGKGVLLLQHLVRHIAVVVDHLVLSDPWRVGMGAKMGLNG